MADCLCLRGVAKKPLDPQSRKSSRVASVGRGTLFGSGTNLKSNRVSMTGVPGDPFQGKRQSIAVVECPLPNLVGRCSESQRTSIQQRASCSPATSVLARQSIAIPISRNASVSALEVCPASPEREKLIELYIYTSHTVENAKNETHLVQFLQGIERHAVNICNSSTMPLTETQQMKFKTMYEFDSDNPRLVERYNHTFSVIGLEDGEDYFTAAREKIEVVKNTQEDNRFLMALSSCKHEHNAMLIENLGGIHIMVSGQLHETAKITKPKGVPFVQLDSANIAHISIGFDDYGQYEVRRADLVEYEKYLEQLGLLEFMEEEEDEC